MLHPTQQSLARLDRVLDNLFPIYRLKLRMEPEIKQRRESTTDTACLVSVLETARMRMQLMKQQLLRRADRGKQLPIRLLARILEFSSFKETAAAQAVCGSWRLP